MAATELWRSGRTIRVARQTTVTTCDGVTVALPVGTLGVIRTVIRRVYDHKVLAVDAAFTLEASGQPATIFNRVAVDRLELTGGV